MKSINQKTNIFFTILYFVILIEILYFSAGQLEFSNTLSFIFSISTLFAYPFLYMLPSITIILAIKHTKISRKETIIAVIAALSSGLTTSLIFIDYKIFSMYGFHINSFVLNLIFTPGGLESMGASTLDYIAVSAFGILCCIASYIIFYFTPQVPIKTVYKISSVTLLLLLFTISSTSYAYSQFKSIPNIYSISRAFPAYIPIRMRTFFRAIGIKQIKNSGLKLKNDDKLLNYPLEPINIKVKNKKYNIVWLVAESWRADTLNKKIMPATYDFAKKCFRFHNHYSSGNGTRMALCGMFYGLYGSYWKALLAEHTEPIIFKALHKLNYQMDLYTSAKFTYPEFDQTIFSSIKKSQMHQSDGRGGYINDKNNITNLLKFIKKRDKNRPFMTFMFFESPHAPYVFPESSVIEKDYLKTFNYTTVNIEKNITKIKNRYINSVHNLDNELKRVFEFLKNENLMDSTIVILTGDHGEEFLEKGHWGHNKGFHQEEVKPPMLLYIPDHKDRDIYKMTSHLDIVPTIAPFLGINNAPSTYSLGYNMLLNETRSFTACASWDQLCYIDDKIKYVIDPVAFNITTTIDDKQLDDDKKNKESNMQIVEMIKNSTKFYKKR